MGTGFARDADRATREGAARALHRQAGMTLLEIMIVLAIIGTIMAVVGGAVYSRYKRSQVQTTKLLLNHYKQAIVEWSTHNPGPPCPPSLEELYAEKFATSKAQDAWGQPLVYRCPDEGTGDGYAILSKGPDRQEGTKDDIKGWEEE